MICTQFVDSMPSVSSALHDREAWQETDLQKQQDNARSVDGGSSECQNLISSVDLEATKQQLLTLEEVRVKTNKVIDLEEDFKSECVKVIRLENELKNKEELHTDLEVKFKEVNQKL